MTFAMHVPYCLNILSYQEIKKIKDEYSKYSSFQGESFLEDFLLNAFPFTLNFKYTAIFIHNVSLLKSNYGDYIIKYPIEIG